MEAVRVGERRCIWISIEYDRGGEQKKNRTIGNRTVVLLFCGCLWTELLLSKDILGCLQVKKDLPVIVLSRFCRDNTE